MEKKLFVYIASPYSIGDKPKNVKVQIDTYYRLYKLGFIPIAPLLSHFVDMYYPIPNDEWLKIDKELILRCDCLLRLPGESKGADIEMKFALNNEISVFTNYQSLILYGEEKKAIEEARKVLKDNEGNLNDKNI